MEPVALELWLWKFSFGSLALELQLSNFGFGPLAWELLLGIFGFWASAWIFRLGSEAREWARDAGGMHWPGLGECSEARSTTRSLKTLSNIPYRDS